MLHRWFFVYDRRTFVMTQKLCFIKIFFIHLKIHGFRFEDIGACFGIYVETLNKTISEKKLRMRFLLIIYWGNINLCTAFEQLVWERKRMLNARKSAHRGMHARTSVHLRHLIGRLGRVGNIQHRRQQWTLNAIGSNGSAKDGCTRPRATDGVTCELRTAKRCRRGDVCGETVELGRIFDDKDSV